MLIHLLDSNEVKFEGQGHRRSREAALLNSSIDSTGAPKCCFRPSSRIHSWTRPKTTLWCTSWINRWI